MDNKDLDKQLGGAFFDPENTDDELISEEEKSSAENEGTEHKNSESKTDSDSESKGNKENKDNKLKLNRHRVIRSLNKDKIQQSEDSRVKQKRILETAMRKSMSLSVIISVILAGLFYFSSISLNYYREQSEEKKSEEHKYADLFQRLGLRSKDAAVNDSYVSNKEKVEKQYRLSLERKKRGNNAKGDSYSSEDSNPDGSGSFDNASNVQNGDGDNSPKDKTVVSDGDSGGSPESGNNVNGVSTANVVDKFNLQKLAGKGPIDYQSAEPLFDDSYYKDVEEMLGSKDTLVKLEKTDGGYIQHFPYLNIFSAGEYPLLPKSQEVSDEYFENSCFIGDSIMSIFSAGASYDADFFAKPVMQTINALDEFEFTNKDGKEGTVRQLLTYKKYDKIYILLGTNDGAFGDANKFKERYRKIVDYVRSCQADAEIYIMALFPISAEYEEEGRFPTNEFFAGLNRALLELCRETGNFFLDYGSYMRSAYGVLPEDAAHDGIHFTIEYVPAWEEYISTHTWDGALSLLDPSIKMLSKKAVKEKEKSLEEALPDLNESTEKPAGENEQDQLTEIKDEQTDETDSADGSEKEVNKDNKKIDKSIIDNKEKSIKNNELAIAEEGKNIPSAESMSSVYEAAFANSDPDIKERLDSLYGDITGKIKFDDKMSSIRIKNIPSFYGLDLNSIADARILRGSGATAEELLIFRFKTDDEAMDARQTLVNYRQKRIESYRDYVPSEVPRLEKSRIVRNGKYIFFVVATDSNLLESIVDKY